MITLQINGLDFISKPYISILEACKAVGITAPRFCYHETLSIAGNCRMCLVEIEGMEKPVASCVTEVEEKMSIKVDSAFAKKARENVVEAILLNHPLDCPICDQAGECDLQDQTKSFGANHSRFFFPKASVEDKECGNLVKTIMTRCIKCTRCVRYTDEIIGNAAFATLSRGVHSEIGGYKSNILKSEISGNIVDLCPVGALTSKTYAFQARPWELRVSETYSVTDSYGASVYVNYRGSDILRILPKNNIKLNNSLITDKTRHSYDSNQYGRLQHSYVLTRNSNDLLETQIESISLNNNPTSITNRSHNIYINQETDLDTLFSVLSIQNNSKASLRVVDLDTVHNNDNSCLPFLQKNISGKMESLVILLGTNLKLENALLNARLRHKYRNSLLNVLVTGSGEKTTFPSLAICGHIKGISSLFEGRNALFSRLINKVSNFTLFVGESFYQRAKSADFCVYTLKRFFKNAFIIRTHLYSNSAGAKLLNIKRVPITHKKPSSNVAVNLRSNFQSTLATKTIQKRNFEDSYLLTTHGSQNAFNFKHVIPTLDNFETSRAFVNLEYNLIKTANIWEQTRYSANSLPNLLYGLLTTQAFPRVESIKPKWISYLDLESKKDNQISTSSTFISLFDVNKSFTANKTKCFKYFLKSPMKDFHLSSFEAKNSKVMQACSKESHDLFVNFTPISKN